MRITEKYMTGGLFSAICSYSMGEMIGKAGNDCFLKYDEKPRMTEFAVLSEYERNEIGKFMPVSCVKKGKYIKI